MTSKFRGNLLLILVAMIWGLAFVAQVQGVGTMGPLSFNFIRNIIASLTLWLVMMIRPSLANANTRENSSQDLTVIGGIITGFVLALAMAFQQIGIQDSTAGKAGFITALYIVLVPVLGVFVGRKVSWLKWLAVLLATIGLYLLTVTANFQINQGDINLFICAILYTFHILVIDYFSPKSNSFKLSFNQFVTAALVSGLLVLFYEDFSLSQIQAAIVPLLYLGVLSSGVGYTVQVVAQQYTDPTSASLILSSESVFAVIFGAIILGERLGQREWLGAILMFCAIILSQLNLQKT